jgi:AmmeMemoRadiSam system protein B/AmmeMemoRadiSam system protein A
MKTKILRLFLSVGLVLSIISCKSQVTDNSQTKIDRKPAVSGSFYPSDPKELKSMLEGFFRDAPSSNGIQLLAIVVPHAGYVFSGGVAASAFKQIDRNKKFKHVFIIASSHTMYFEGVSVYSQGDFITPLGKVAVDTLTGCLDSKYSFISNNAKPHENEHGIEVQLPFLQYWLKNSFTIIPIIIGSESQSTCRNLAEALAPFFNDDNLFIVSSDFSHYPNYVDAAISDKTMADAITSNSSQRFMKAKLIDEAKGTPNLVTAMCGWTSMLTLLDITEGRNDVAYEKIIYKNSGDTPQYGDKERVVGYNAFSVIKTDTKVDKIDFKLNEEEKIELLKIARSTISEYLSSKSLPEISEKKLPANLLVPTGAFVTLKEKGQLRGCIGSFNQDQPLYKVVQSMAIASATEDYRFSKVTYNEVSVLEIEISVLTPLKKINSVTEIVLGQHGIYIKKGGRSGTFLPQVATGTGWNLEEFLGHCAQDKAFIGWDGWKDAEIYTYEAIVFEEKEFKGKLK